MCGAGPAEWPESPEPLRSAARQPRRNPRPPSARPATTAATSKRATHPIRTNAPDQKQRTRSGPTHPIRRGAMPTDRVHCHRQQAQTRKWAVNAGTTRPPQARRSHITTPTPRPHEHSQPPDHKTRDLTQCLCHLGPTGGRTNPFMRSWALQVEHGHPRPRSTHRVNVRIQGPRYPPIGPNMPSNSGTTPGTTTCPPAPHRHRGPPGAPRPEPHGPESTASRQTIAPAHSTATKPAAGTPQPGRPRPTPAAVRTPPQAACIRRGRDQPRTLAQPTPAS